MKDEQVSITQSSPTTQSWQGQNKVWTEWILDWKGAFIYTVYDNIISKETNGT